jgi:hypothetical protein
MRGVLHVIIAFTEIPKADLIEIMEAKASGYGVCLMMGGSANSSSFSNS